MSRSRTVLTLAFAMLVASAASGLAQQLAAPAQEPAAPVVIDVTGDWIVTMETGNAALTLKQEGTVLSGVLQSPQGSLELEGEIEGNELVFWGYFDAYTLNFYASVEENKKMVGALEAAGGEFVVDFSALRKEQS